MSRDGDSTTTLVSLLPFALSSHDAQPSGKTFKSAKIFKSSQGSENCGNAVPSSCKFLKGKSRKILFLGCRKFN